MVRKTALFVVFRRLYRVRGLLQMYVTFDNCVIYFQFLAKFVLSFVTRTKCYHPGEEPM